MSNIVNLNGVRNSFSLPLQIITAVLLLMQVFFFVIIVYLRRNFQFNPETFTSIKGWIMLGVTIFFIGWNILALIQRKRQINKASTTEEKESIYKASTLVRFMTMDLISIVALVFALIWKDFYFFIFFAVSVLWQVAMFPTKSKIAMAIHYEVEPHPEVSAEPTQSIEPEQPQQDNVQI